MPKKPSKAGTFDVWGPPPDTLTRKMTPQQINILRRYVDAVVHKCYRIAYDNGHVEGLTAVVGLAQKRLQRRMTAGMRARS